MSDILAKIEKLIRLATSPFPEEARTAAHKAAQLIRDHGIVLSIPPVTGARRAEPAAPRPRPPTAAQEEMTKRVVIVSKFSGFCRVCSSDYQEGERVAWARGKGAIHTACQAAERRTAGGVG